MAVVRDVMAAFELFQPTSISDAQNLLEQHDPTSGSWPEVSTASTG